MVACALYCGPCAKAHKLLEEALSQNDIGCTIRFYVDLSMREDKRLKAIEYLLQVLKDSTTAQKRDALHVWYDTLNFEHFSEIYKLKKHFDVLDQLTKHEEWVNSSKIKGTPTIFINGYEWPKIYQREDLPEIIRGLVARSKEVEDSFNELENNKSHKAEFFIAQ